METDFLRTTTMGPKELITILEFNSSFDLALKKLLPLDKHMAALYLVTKQLVKIYLSY